MQSIIDVPKPNTKVELQRYLGMVNFYHRFLPGIAAALSPLHALVAAAKSPKSKLVWSPPTRGARRSCSPRYCWRTPSRRQGSP